MILDAVFARSSPAADLLLEVPRAHADLLGGWLGSAAVVGEWMQAQAVDAVFALPDGTLLAIVPTAAANQHEERPGATVT